jgi:MoaA/NifB/PqqE/SkfB family radical SAM enzyme
MPLLDIVLGYDCNLGCTYCTITGEMRRRALPAQRVAREIDRAAARGFKEVAFTGGEPTIREDLPALVKHARRRGFEHVKVASNGLRYAHAPYLDHLVACGVDRFHVSMHAFADVDYEATVRLAGTAPLRRAAIANLVARGLDPVADLILKEDTYRGVREWVSSLHGLGVRRFALWLVSLTDQNEGNVAQLPRLPDVARAMEAALDDARRGGYEVVSLHVPRCFLPGREEHVRHPGADLVTVVTPDDVFDLKDSRLGGGVQPAGCQGCRWASACPGLRRDYVAVFGEDEVRAVAPPG